MYSTPFHGYSVRANPGREIYLRGGIFIEILTASMASVGKPRSYMIQSIRLWSLVFKAEVESIIRA